MCQILFFLSFIVRHTHTYSMIKTSRIVSDRWKIIVSNCTVSFHTCTIAFALLNESDFLVCGRHLFEIVEETLSSNS